MSMRPKRQTTAAAPAVEDFEDPLSDYSGPDYDDEIERSLAEDEVTALTTRPVKTIPPDTTIEAAMKLMVDLDIASLPVTQGDKLVGIFSERDVLTKVAERFKAMRNRPISEVMTPKPIAIHETDSPGKALNVMVTGGFRHVPILDVDDKVVGILGPRRVTAYLQKYFTALNKPTTKDLAALAKAVKDRKTFNAFLDALALEAHANGAAGVESLIKGVKSWGGKKGTPAAALKAVTQALLHARG